MGRSQSAIRLGSQCQTESDHGFVRSETAEAIDFVLYCERNAAGRRHVRELISVTGYAHAEQAFQTEEIYRAPNEAD